MTKTKADKSLPFDGEVLQDLATYKAGARRAYEALLLALQDKDECGFRKGGALEKAVDKIISEAKKAERAALDEDYGYDDGDDSEDGYADDDNEGPETTNSATQAYYAKLNGFRMDARGLFIDGMWCCSSIETLGEVCDPKSNNWGKCLRFRDRKGVLHTRVFAYDLIYGEPGPLIQALALAGVKIKASKKKEIAAYLQLGKTRGLITLVKRVGWHEISDKQVFVMPDETIAPDGCGKVILDSSVRNLFSKKGTLKGWQDGIATLAKDHKVARIMLGTSLSGPLAYLINAENGGWNGVGLSRRGKSSLIYAAAATHGAVVVRSGVLPRAGEGQ